MGARIVRHECEARTVCLDIGTVGTCVADPAETCEIVGETRCVDDLEQRCRDVDAVSLTSGVQYWYWAGGLSCDG